MSRVPESIVFRNARIIDGTADRPRNGVDVLIADGRIRDLSDGFIKTKADLEIDLTGKFLLPGLIDCHVHVVATTVRLAENALFSDSLVTAKAIGILGGMIRRGFTTVRDCGGADYGLQQAVELGLIKGPRLVISGKALSQTGGHSDFRGRYDTRPSEWFGNRLGALGYAVDGVENLRLAVRKQLKAGAQFIKLMGNGGVASPTDPVEFLGYSRDELKTAVEEAKMAKTYVAAHLYTAESIKRAVECGVRCIEHATLTDGAAASLIQQANGVAVPTLIIFESLKKRGKELGFPKEAMAKIDDVRLSGPSALETLKRAGVPMGFGTDLLGETHQYQSEEFILRHQVLPAHEVIRSATVDAATVLGMEGLIGCIKPGAFADLIVMDTNPLNDISAMTGQGRHMPMIIKEGIIHKNKLK